MVLPQKVNTGITIQGPTDLVPEYDEREAAIYSLIPWNQWDKMSYGDRVGVVAHYRVHQQIEAHIHQAYEDDAKMRAPIS